MNCHDLRLLVMKKVQKDKQTRSKRERSVSPLCNPELLEDLIKRHAHVPRLPSAMKRLRPRTSKRKVQVKPSEADSNGSRVNDWSKLTGFDNASLQTEYAEYQESTGKCRCNIQAYKEM